MTRRFANYAYPAQPPWTWLDTFLVALASGIAVLCLAVIMVLCLVTGAFAHDTGKGWSYPWECCHDRDCEEISETRVRPAPGGYMVDGRFMVRQADVRPSPDGRYHACFPNPDKLQCLFVPPSGS